MANHRFSHYTPRIAWTPGNNVTRVTETYGGSRFHFSDLRTGFKMQFARWSGQCRYRAQRGSGFATASLCITSPSSSHQRRRFETDHHGFSHFACRTAILAGLLPVQLPVQLVPGCCYRCSKRPQIARFFSSIDCAALTTNQKVGCSNHSGRTTKYRFYIILSGGGVWPLLLDGA